MKANESGKAIGFFTFHFSLFTLHSSLFTFPLIISQLLQHLVRDVYLGRAVDDASGFRGAVEHQRVATQFGNFFYGVVYLVLYGRHEAFALLEELALGAEVFAFQVRGIFLFLHDGLLSCLLLFLREKHQLVLIVFIHCGGLGVEGLDLGLPFLRYLVELLVGTLVGGYVFEDILHVEQRKLLCAGREHCRNSDDG